MKSQLLLTVVVACILSSSAFAQSSLDASATVFSDSNSMSGVMLPDVVATASAGYAGVENISGSLSTNTINANANTDSRYGIGQVSAFTSNLLTPVGSRFVGAGTTSVSTAVSNDRLTFSWDAGYDNTQPINAQFFLEVELPESDPMNSGFVFDAGTTFQLQSNMRVTSVSGSVNPTFNIVNVNQSHLAFSPGVSTDNFTVTMSDGARVALVGSLNLNVGGFVRANSDNPADDIFSNEIGLTGFYRIKIVVPEGVIVQSDSTFDYTQSVCIADINDDGQLDFFDVSQFLTLFQAGDLGVDFNGDGDLNFFDVSAYLVAFQAGCP